MLNYSLAGFEDHFLVSILLSLHLQLGTPQAFMNNVSTAVSFILTNTYSVRNASIPFIIHMIRNHKQVLLERNFIEPLENQFATWLINASTKVTQPSNNSMTNLFSKKMTKSVYVTEIDGSQCKDIFTVANDTPYYSEDQVFNIMTFSFIYTWIYHLYVVNPNDNLKISKQFKDAVLKYCLRVIEQSNLKTVGTKDSLSRRLPDMALIESVRILNLLCQIDDTIVRKLFSMVKKLFSLTRPAWNSRSNGFFFLEIMGFYIQHGDSSLFDIDPVFRQYFDTYLSQNFTDPLIAFETMHFCVKHKEVLLMNSNIFSQHFHSLLRIFAWYPNEFFEEAKQLLPAFINQTTYMEIFHAIIDLPLLVAALERMEPEVPNKGSMSGRYFSSTNDNYRLLFNLLLRKESGVTINFWESSNTLALLKSFLNDVYLTPRIYRMCKLVPIYLEIFFDVIFKFGENQLLYHLITSLFYRIDQLFPYKPFENKVRRTLINNMLAAFEKYPLLLIEHQDLIIEYLGDTIIDGRGELILHLIWAIGEYVSCEFEEYDLGKVFTRYDEALELFAFEHMSNSIAITQEQTTKDFTTKNQVFNTRMMLVIISTLTKLASKWQPLKTRVKLYLEKYLTNAQYFHPSVIQRTKQCLNMLKHPSIALMIMGTDEDDLDRNLIFPSQFLNQNEIVSMSFEQKPLHPYVL